MLPCSTFCAATTCRHDAALRLPATNSIVWAKIRYSSAEVLFLPRETKICLSTSVRPSATTLNRKTFSPQSHKLTWNFRLACRACLPLGVRERQYHLPGSVIHLHGWS